MDADSEQVHQSVGLLGDGLYGACVQTAGIGRAAQLGGQGGGLGKLERLVNLVYILYIRQGLRL